MSKNDKSCFDPVRIMERELFVDIQHQRKITWKTILVSDENRHFSGEKKMPGLQFSI